jgi:hypothetical protein
MKIHRNIEMTIAIIAISVAALSNYSFARERMVEEKRAVVFWNGVNGCKPSPKPGFDYVWQENAENLKGSLQNYPNEFAQPFGIMARKHDSPQKVAEDIDAYLQSCREQGKIPLVVLAPDLNIEGYFATLNPGKLNPLTLHAEVTVQEDIRWTRSITPIILSKLSEAGYISDGYGHSWGGTMAVEGMEAGSTTIRSLTIMNARVPNSSSQNLQDKGLVENLWRITTAGDALTYWGKAAFGKGDVYIKQAEIKGWDDLNPGNAMSTHHNVVLRPGSTKVTIETDGKIINTDLRSILRHETQNVSTAPKSKESGVSMKMDIKEESFRKDETGRLDALKNDVLNKRPR